MPKHTTRILLATVVLGPFLAASSALAACAQPATGTPSAPKDVLLDLHHSNQKEIQMGRQAKEQGQSQEVKNYGEMLMRDHADADKKVEALASKKNVSLTAPPRDEQQHANMPQGKAFDKHFAEMMIKDHKKDISTVRTARDQTNDPEVKQLLDEMLPTLEKHLETAKDLAGKS